MFHSIKLNYKSSKSTMCRLLIKKKTKKPLGKSVWCKKNELLQDMLLSESNELSHHPHPVAFYFLRDLSAKINRIKVFTLRRTSVPYHVKGKHDLKSVTSRPGLTKTWDCVSYRSVAAWRWRNDMDIDLYRLSFTSLNFFFCPWHKFVPDRRARERNFQRS